MYGAPIPDLVVVYPLGPVIVGLFIAMSGVVLSMLVALVWWYGGSLD